MSELIVYLSDRRAGRLIRKDNGNLQFRYDPGYSGPAISQALPVQQDAHPHAVVRAVFGGLLLEGDAREALAATWGFRSATTTHSCKSWEATAQAPSHCSTPRYRFRARPSSSR